jgi:D-arginine dehydrogenase
MTDKLDDIAIIGGGLAGLTTAWSLQKEGYSNVTILEKGESTTMEASGLNTGVIRHYHESRRIRRELQRGISLLASYQKRHNTYFFEQKPSLWRVSNDRCLDLEQQEVDHLKWNRASGEDIPAQFSGKDDEQACWITFEDDALLDSVTLGGLLREEVEHSSVTVRTNASVVSGTKADGQWTLSLEDAPDLTADLVVNAAGAWANDVAERLGLEPVNMEPVPRRLFLVEDDLVPESLSYVMDPERQIALRRAEAGTLISYAGVEDKDTPDQGKEASHLVDQLHDVIASEFPRLMISDLQRSWSGWYAMTPDRKPVIEPDEEDVSVIHATGLNDYGLSYGFHVGEKVLELL